MISNPYILYIEDERPAIDLVRKTLKPLGYEVAGVSCGHQGLAMMRQRKPDLLLLDLRMPYPNGCDVYRAMKQDKTLADVPVLVVTAKVPDRGRVIDRNLPPVNDYITKPFKLERLRRAVSQAAGLTLALNLAPILA